jgi:hypothetical protein
MTGTSGGPNIFERDLELDSIPQEDARTSIE